MDRFFRRAEIASFLVEVLAVGGVKDRVAFDKGEGLQTAGEVLLAPENKGGHGVGPDGAGRTLVLEQARAFLFLVLGKLAWHGGYVQG